MSKLSLFVFLTSVCFGAVTYAVPRQIKALKSVGFIFQLSTRGAIFQGMFLSIVGAVVGIALSDRTGFAVVALPEFAESGNLQTSLLMLLGATALTTLAAFAGHFIIYYLIFRPRLPTNYVITGERIRLRMGILARVLQGGVAEEVQFRWGTMSVAVWFGTLLFPDQGDWIVWGGIALSALIFALFHLAGAIQLGIGNSLAGTSLTVIDNMWVGIAFGWLFWRYGLLAAIMSHALIHVIWFPVERFFHARYLEKKNAV